jgi:hypothetical protein
MLIKLCQTVEASFHMVGRQFTRHLSLFAYRKLIATMLIPATWVTRQALQLKTHVIRAQQWTLQHVLLICCAFPLSVRSLMVPHLCARANKLFPTCLQEYCTVGYSNDALLPFFVCACQPLLAAVRNCAYIVYLHLMALLSHFVPSRDTQLLTFSVDDVIARACCTC